MVSCANQVKHAEHLSLQLQQLRTVICRAFYDVANLLYSLTIWTVTEIHSSSIDYPQGSWVGK